MKTKFRCLNLLLVLLLCVPCLAQAEDEEGGQQKYGVIHNIADDRKVEKVGGIYEPEGIDKYMKRRFDAMDERLGAIEGQIAQISADVKDLGKKIEESNKKKDEEATLVSKPAVAEKKRPS
jgi:hypothetical protein